MRIFDVSTLFSYFVTKMLKLLCSNDCGNEGLWFSKIRAHYCSMKQYATYVTVYEILFKF